MKICFSYNLLNKFDENAERSSEKSGGEGDLV